MNVIASYEVNQAYLEAHFRDWLSLAPWYRKWQTPISVALALAGITILTTTHSFALTGGLMVVIGIVELLEGIWFRHTWVARRMKARAHLPHQLLEIRFSAEAIEHSGPLSSGKIDWSAVTAFRETANAVILELGENSVLYVPKSSIKPATGISEIRARASQNLANVGGSQQVDQR